MKPDDLLSNNLNQIRNFKKWGLVKRNGKEFWRNYNRELKNGKGKSSWDLILDSIFAPCLFWEHLKKKEKDERKEEN